MRALYIEDRSQAIRRPNCRSTNDPPIVSTTTARLINTHRRRPGPVAPQPEGRENPGIESWIHVEGKTPEARDNSVAGAEILLAWSVSLWELFGIELCALFATLNSHSRWALGHSPDGVGTTAAVVGGSRLRKKSPPMPTTRSVGEFI